ncbi:phosphatase PAP2 family protein [Janibacter sp. G56]|uniref:phosphatase PAP2 family protein n=1 Tax=Janibacter sp. G56 TaxID=3418717 RepID=UPI003D019F6D
MSSHAQISATESAERGAAPGDVDGRRGAVTVGRPGPSAREVISVLALTAVVLAVTTLLGHAILGSPGFLRSDATLVDDATTLTAANPWLRSTAMVWAEVSQPVVLWAVLIVAALTLWLTGRGEAAPRQLAAQQRLVRILPLSMLVWMTGVVAKGLVHRPRPTPDPDITTAWGTSYPSGHALNSAAFAVLFVALVAPLLRTKVARGTLIVVLAVGAALTSVDRVLLGVHHVSDVVIGAIVGLAIAFGGLRLLHVRYRAHLGL